MAGPALIPSPAPPGAQAAANSLSFQGLNQLRAAANADPRSPAAIKAVAQQFEALLLQQMLQAMSATSFGPDMLGDTAGPMYQSLFNQQIASSVSQGRGIGLASFIARELATRYGATGNASAPAATSPSPGASSGASPAALLTTGSAAAAFAAPPRTALAAPQQATGAPLATPLATPLAATPAPASTAVAGSAAPASAAADTDAVAQARQFIAGILPDAQRVARQLGVTPLAILAQAALETGWGRNTPGNNLFGIKAGAGWDGGSVGALTREFIGGAWNTAQAAFRAYASVADSLSNYAALLSGPRYRAALGHGDDVAGFASALQRSGYATDPQYANKLLAVAHGSTMRQALASLGVGSSFATP